MSIELTTDQAIALASEGDNARVIDPMTKATYRLVREEVFEKVQNLLYDDSPWTASEMGLLAGMAFGQDDDTDYSEYLRAKP